jgi:hypothetical protein
MYLFVEGDVHASNRLGPMDRKDLHLVTHQEDLQAPLEESYDR